MKTAAIINGIELNSDNLQQVVAELPLDQVKALNRAAWRRKEAAARRADQFNNITRNGWAPFDAACRDYDFCDKVAKLTWRRMQGAA